MNEKIWRNEIRREEKNKRDISLAISIAYPSVVVLLQL
jgi:hypothetical protein